MDHEAGHPITRGESAGWHRGWTEREKTVRRTEGGHPVLERTEGERLKGDTLPSADYIRGSVPFTAGDTLWFADAQR